MKQATSSPYLFVSEQIPLQFSIWISEDRAESSNFDSEMPITAASLNLAIHWSSSIFGKKLLMLICTKCRLLFLKTAHCPLIIVILLRTINRSWVKTYPQKVIVAIKNKSCYSGTWDWKNKAGSALDWNKPC